MEHTTEYPQWVLDLVAKHALLLGTSLNYLIRSNDAAAKSAEKANIAALNKAFTNVWRHHTGEGWSEPDPAMVEYLTGVLLGQSKH